MTRFEEIVSKAEIAACIVGNPEVADFALIGFGASSEKVEQYITERKLAFIGVIGLVNGEAHTALAMPIDPEAALALSESFAGFVKRVVRESKPDNSGDSLAFLERLYKLPDTRN